MNNKTTHALRFLVRGAVQGVGFRPFIYREAIARQLHGWVKNTPDGVDILVVGNEHQLADFEAHLRYAPPPRAKIESIDVFDAGEASGPVDFRILDSELQGENRATILPDLATCADCLREINDPANRRFRYPFTNCTNCGPRYSILTGLPYDRDRTTMRTFAMCPACRIEFENPEDRRFHAQPNACPACGPQVALWDAKGQQVNERDEAIRDAVEHIKAGHIVAVKGIGGFHLLCDATNDQSIRLLRQRKHREEKPFAVMVPALGTAHDVAHLNEQEANWLASPAAPIMLLKRKSSSLPASIAPDNPWLGLFLPYTPLHHLLMGSLKRPVIATSGNISDEPICTDETQALHELAGIADVFLVHNRPIAHPVDDSVMRIVLDEPLVLRAGRGLAPLSLPAPEIAVPVLGLGAHMKATVSLRHHDRIIVSPHIGDIGSVAAEKSLVDTANLLKQLHDTKNATVACDLHPDYASTKLAERRNAPTARIQHHHAHVLAVMAEHAIAGPVLGVAWDGTGLGDDGTVWGGEFLRVEKNGYHRTAYLRPFPLPGGDAAAREPRRAALGVLHALSLADRDFGFSKSEIASLQQAMRKGINTVMTSSAGRLFDAAAALLDLCYKSSYEGHAAMLLQAEAEKVEQDVTGYEIEATTGAIEWSPIIRGMMHDRTHNIDVPLIAARFHQSLVDLIAGMVRFEPDLPVLLCGGCFQNSWLLERTVKKLRCMGRKVYWPHILPPNDGAISAGQVTASIEAGV